MPTQAKICGLSTPDTLAAAVAGHTAYVGFVFFPPSPRHLAFDQAASLARQVPGHVEKVGVFVDPEDALLDAAIGAGQLDIVQLHKVTPERASAIKARFGRRVWAALAIKARADLIGAKRFVGAADMILYDAKTPDGAALPGGMGVRFDWALLQGFHHPLAWALSGGLTPDNVADAIAQTGATLVDVSSGVESAPGVKDAVRISEFLAAVANA
ncbi:MAG: phosphoribosylanthranilate isomerase [Sphingomonas sp.]|jgi:phosphoribosylanthranilate isomerase